MKSINIPRLSTRKPPKTKFIESLFETQNVLKQAFNQSAPNLVWCSDITYLPVQNRFFYLCVIIDLFSHKVIAYRLSNKADANLVIDTFLQAYSKRGYPQGLMFHSDRGVQIPPLHLEKFWITATSFNPFLKKVILTTTPLLNASLNTSNSKKPTADFIILLTICLFLFFNTLTVIIIPGVPVPRLFLTPNQFEHNFFSRA